MADGRRKYRSDLKEHKITVKVSETELELVDTKAKDAGMNRSRYIRELIHGNGNIDSTFAIDRANLIRQVSGVATNVNQITRMRNCIKSFVMLSVCHVGQFASREKIIHTTWFAVSS